MRLFTFIGNFLSTTDKAVTHGGKAVVEIGRTAEGLAGTAGDYSNKARQEARKEYMQAYASTQKEMDAIKEQFPDINWDEMP